MNRSEEPNIEIKDTNKICGLTPPPPPPPPPPNKQLKLSNNPNIIITSSSTSTTTTSKFVHNQQNKNNESKIDFTQQLLKFNRDQLLKTKIKIRTPDGRVFEEQLLANSGQSFCEYKGLDEYTTTKIYNQVTGLSSFSYCKNVKSWVPYIRATSEFEIQSPPPTSTEAVDQKVDEQQQQEKEEKEEILVAAIKEQVKEREKEMENNHNILTFITFNVWFDQYFWKERANHLFKIIKEKTPDIVCLQEVTPVFLDYLTSQLWVKDNYCLSDNGNLDTVYPYGVVVLFKFKTMFLESMCICPLPSTKQSRKTLCCTFKYKYNKNKSTMISIATAHFESLDINSSSRVRQFNYISDHLDSSNSNHMFIMGDFNFGTNYIENDEIPKRSFNDLWCQFNNTDDNGYTYIKKKNRVDRILFKSNNNSSFSNGTNDYSTLMPYQISLIGGDPIPINEHSRSLENIAADELIYPSDHYGLYGKFIIN
ncbi:hypothetical protein CYY_000367 [Polysphondylium violaceum]|uniref:Endonuclease/exonuclease/phosphatase domain-containing protein n=1 Tax=Polysphondylium violaceum TaxID=133409 RepID=A0A8J4Q503_9MYCE|nr:hypothetical protein CYY_000367 [Polysphondylium violaceum]